MIIYHPFQPTLCWLWSLDCFPISVSFQEPTIPWETWVEPLHYQTYMKTTKERKNVRHSKHKAQSLLNTFLNDRYWEDLCMQSRKQQKCTFNNHNQTHGKSNICSIFFVILHLRLYDSLAMQVSSFYYNRLMLENMKDKLNNTHKRCSKEWRPKSGGRRPQMHTPKRKWSEVKQLRY